MHAPPRSAALEHAPPFHLFTHSTRISPVPVAFPFRCLFLHLLNRPVVPLLFIPGAGGVARVVIVISMMSYLVGFGVGVATVPTVVCSEIYPLRVRSVAMSQAMLVNWLSNYCVSATFLSLTDSITTGGTFSLFGAAAVVGVVWVYYYLPETAGLPLEQVGKVFEDPYPWELRDRADLPAKVTESSRLVKG